MSKDKVEHWPLCPAADGGDGECICHVESTPDE